MASKLKLVVLGMAAALPVVVAVWGWSQYSTRGRAEASGAELQSQLEEQEKAFENLRDDYDKCAAQLAQVQAQARGLDGKINEVTSALDTAEAHLKLQAADLENERKKNEELAAALKAKGAEAAPTGLEIAKAQDKPEAPDELKKAKEEAAAAKRALGTAQEQVKAKDAELARLRAAVQKSSDDLTQLRAENARLSKEVELLQAEVTRLRKRPFARK